MSSLFPLVISNTSFDMEERLPFLLGAQPTRSNALAYCRNLRMRGILTLLLSAKSEEFHRCLALSGQVFCNFLRRAPEAEKVTSDSLPFFDALAAGDLACAEAIARTSRHTWAPDDEEEEDFLFVELVMQATALAAPAAQRDALLVRYEAIAQETGDARLPIAKALLARDAAAFDAALSIYLEGQRAAFRERVTEGTISPERGCTEAKVSTEGLGLVILAERLGLSTQRDYPMVPFLARVERPPKLAPDAWARLP